MPLRITASGPDPQLLSLPWQLPLEQWPNEHIVKLPKGISRHVVRFSELSGQVVAVKETNEEMAAREYELLGSLRRLDMPSVDRVAVIAGRQDANGASLPSALVTAHLPYSMPYRALFTQALRPDTLNRALDALALLLVRLHNVGFSWGDVSLSNTLFRRDAGAFAAYLVDAETGGLHEVNVDGDGGLTAGQREYDVDLAHTNIAGEIFDLAASGRIDPDVDAVGIANGLVNAYRSLWSELTEQEEFELSESWRITERVRRLNGLGFDIGEMSMKTTPDGTRVSIRPKVVDAGHHQRRLLRLTGLDVEENQARRLLNDLDEYRAKTGRTGDEDDSVIAHEWLTTVFEPVVRAIPFELRAKLEPAEVFHEVLEHRWHLSQMHDASVSLAETLSSYIDTVLRHRRDEATIMGPPTETLTSGIDTAPPRNWRDLV